LSKKKIVSNSSPIILSLKIDFIPVLKKMYQRIIIPEGVFREITSKEDSQIDGIPGEEFLQVKTAKNDEKINSLSQFLGRGEIEYIVLSQEITADTLIIDDRRGRYYAESSGIKTIGIVGLIIKAYRAGLIDDFAKRLNRLIDVGFRIKKEFMEENIPTIRR
jgi:predicted nucleic acid-binding protein